LRYNEPGGRGGGLSSGAVSSVKRKREKEEKKNEARGMRGVEPERNRTNAGAREDRVGTRKGARPHEPTLG